MSTKDIGINTKTVRIPLPRIAGVELKNATVDLERGIVVAEYGQEDLYHTVKTGDFLTCLSDPSKTVIFNSIAPPIGKMKVFTILYDLPILINGKEARTLLGAKLPFSNFRYSTEEEKSLMIEEMEKLGKRYNPETSKIEDMTKEESVKKLEVGKDYINVYDSNIIVIDRTGDIENRGFYGDLYKNHLTCANPSEWREATEQEVIDAFKKRLVCLYGEDWRTMKIKEKHPSLSSSRMINDGLWEVEISKYRSGWYVWNKNGLLYCNGIWVDRLVESKIHIQDAIKENTVIHCETEEEAKRILGMAHTLGYKWHNGRNYENNTEWVDCESTTCYYFFEGEYSDYDYFKKNDYTIISSTQIADFEPPKLTGWSLSPEDIKEIKAGEKVDKRYALKRDVLTILSVESKLNPDKKLSEYLEQFKLILEVL